MGMYWQFGTPRSACRKDLFTGLGVLVDTYPNEEKHLEAQKMRYTTRTQRIYPFVLAMVSAPPCCATTITTLPSSSRYVLCRPTIMIDMDGETAWTYRGCGCLRATTLDPLPSQEISLVVLSSTVIDIVVLIKWHLH
uniref:uncharacterized protein LOC124048971 isoform X2 n=1 Tax=Oncorhynchus gorbuscha TaxID=8017 RepID=UPI001EAF2BCD|nr:uncharacterized protein LOC124048971 isoform X2 [Oncorhynchus gorbuscha]